MGKHRIDNDIDNDMVVAAETHGSGGMLASAVALQETGLLVHGMSVTDLLTGLAINGVDAARTQASHGADIFAAAEGEPAFRGSTVSLARLEALRELVYEALDARREAQAEIDRAEREHPRTQFPWGLGLSQPDVVVAGLHAPLLAEYLQAVGLRARTIDASQALDIAAALHTVEREIEDYRAHRTNRATGAKKNRAEVVSPQVSRSGEWGRERAVPHPEYGYPVDNGDRAVGAAGAVGAVGDVGDDAVQSGEDTAVAWGSAEQTVGHIEGRPVRMVVAVAAVLLCLVGVGLAAWGVRSALGERNEAAEQVGGADGVASDTMGTGPTDGSLGATPSPPGTNHPATPTGTSAPGPGPWREHHVAGESMQVASVPRADIPVGLNLDGWRRVSATPAREEFHSSDPDMRILVSAVPTPLTSQADLDRAVVQAVESTDGVRLAGRAPVSYEETYPDSTTLWHVRLVDGHQVSVGCQFRQVTGPRLQTCARAADVAGLDKEAVARP